MKRKIIIVAITTFLVTIAAVYAFAQANGWEVDARWQNHGWMGGWVGDHPVDNDTGGVLAYGPGSVMDARWRNHGWVGGWPALQMSKAQYEQFEHISQSFATDTQALRDDLYSKECELQNELAKDAPDAARASGLQREISDLQSQFEQKRIDYIVEMKSLAPSGAGGLANTDTLLSYAPQAGGYCR